MAEKKIIDLEVRSNIDKTINELNSLESNLKDVRKESTNTKKGIDDVASNGGAIAILDRLTGGLATSFKDAYESTKLFNFTLKGTKTALIATGIGALVVALGVVVAYWDDIVEFVKGTNKELERQNNLIKDNISLLDSKIKTVDSERKLLEAQGKSTKEIIELQNTLLEQKKIQLKTQLLILESQLDDETSIVRKVSLWEKIKVSALTAAGLYKDAAIASAESVIGDEEQIKALKDRQVEIQNLKTAIIDLDLAQIELNKPKTPEGDTTKRDTTKRETAISVNELESPAERYKREQEELLGIKIEQSAIDAQLNLEQIEGKKAFESTLTQIEKEESDERIKQAEAEANAKKYAQDQIVGAVRGSLNSLGILFKQGSAASKAAALADIIIGTGVGFINALEIAQKSAKATGPAAAFAFPIFYATQIAAVLGAAAQAKNVLSQAKAGGSSSGGNISAPSSSPRAAQAPQFNIVGQGGVNQLAESIGSQESKPVRAYVTSNDVTTAQGMDRAIVQGATID